MRSYAQDAIASRTEATGPGYRPRAGAGREGDEIITSQPSPRLYQGFSLLVPNEMLDTPTTPGPLKLNHVSLPGPPGKGD
jgi:hypothetical protein